MFSFWRIAPYMKVGSYRVLNPRIPIMLNITSTWAILFNLYRFPSYDPRLILRLIPCIIPLHSGSELRLILPYMFLSNRHNTRKGCGGGGGWTCAYLHKLIFFPTTLSTSAAVLVFALTLSLEPAQDHPLLTSGCPVVWPAMLWMELT